MPHATGDGPAPEPYPCVTRGCHAPCCDAAEVPLLDADVARLVEATGRPAEAFVDEADGWLVLKGTGLDGCVFRAPRRLGPHRFMGCRVHDVRPQACRHYPFVLHGGVPDQPGPLAVVRDPVCPHADAFVAPPTVRDDLDALEHKLQEERAARGVREPPDAP